MKLHELALLVAFSAASVPLPATAKGALDAKIVLDKVPTAYREVAREYDVPPSILFAVALTESGRSVSNGRLLPWPWTLNVQGRAYYYRDRKTAVAALKRFLKQGRSPDIGLMQVNWRYHGKKLGDPAQAFDPWLNLRAGALILRQAYEHTGDWWLAVGRYHSARPQFAEAYRKRVARWHKRIG